MSQAIFNNIEPTTTTGLMLAALLDDFKDALMTGFSGSSRPANLQEAGMWVDTSLQDAPTYTWSLKIYDGTTDIEVFRLSVLTGQAGFTLADGTFTIQKISADAIGPILSEVKNRVANSGQVLSGDTIAELRISGRTNTSTNPIVAYLRATAAENETSSLRGVTFSLVSVPVSTSQLTEHLRFLTGVVETTQPHKINSLLMGSDSVATATSILMSTDKILSELTGSTPSTIHGIEVQTGETRVKHIHNRSTAEAIIKHNSGSASATERFSLPASEDLILLPGSTAGFFYCETDQRWKYFMGCVAGVRTLLYEFPEGYTEWVAPFTGNIRVTSFQDLTEEPTGALSKCVLTGAGLDGLMAWGNNANGQLGVGDTTNRSFPSLVLGSIKFKDAEISSDSGSGLVASGATYAWGLNDHGQLGVGDTTPRSSPVAVLGGLALTRVQVGKSSIGQQYSGLAYAWGLNDHGQLGVGDVASRSSPVAVLGGLKFSSVFSGADGEGSTFGVERETGSLYAWGRNASGRLGVGDIVSRSSPVAVLGGLKFRKVVLGTNSTLGLTASGAAYGWGANTDGELGLGDVVSRSSPVAVLGGLTFKDIFSLPGNSFFGLTEEGDLYAWGANANGQLGVGDVASRSSPVAVLGGLKWERMARLSSGARSMIAIQKGTGSAYAWGANASGQLGLGDIAPRSSPVAVLGGLKFSFVNMGNEFAYGMESNGIVYSWGSNASGQLGDFSVVAKSSPVLVPGCLEPLFQAPTTKVIPVVKGTTYKIKLGGGASFFDNTYIGKNIRRAVIGHD
jgi:alpha-tubulin suppressor-like RCC1 family protein